MKYQIKVTHRYTTRVVLEADDASHAVNLAENPDALAPLETWDFAGQDTEFVRCVPIELGSAEASDLDASNMTGREYFDALFPADDPCTGCGKPRDTHLLVRDDLDNWSAVCETPTN